MVLGTVSGLLPSRLKSSRQAGGDLDTGIHETIRGLARDLSQVPNKLDAHDPPWGDLTAIVETWHGDRLDTVLTLLEGLDSAIGIEVRQPDASPAFLVYPGPKGEIEVRLPGGTLMVQPWQIITSSAYGERYRDHTESFRKAGDERAWHRWTETHRDGRLIGLQVVQPGLAALAGIGESEATESRVSSPVSSEPSSTPSPAINSKGDEGLPSQPAAVFF